MLPIWSLGILCASAPQGCVPVLAATTRLPALAEPETAAKSVRTYPRALEPTSQSGRQFPKITGTWRAGRGGMGDSGGASTATRVGATGLVTSGYRQPFGAAVLAAELGAAWLERSGLFAHGPGGGREG